MKREWYLQKGESVQLTFDPDYINGRVSEITRAIIEHEESVLINEIAKSNISALIKLRDKINIVLTNHGQNSVQQPLTETSHQ